MLVVSFTAHYYRTPVVGRYSLFLYQEFDIRVPWDGILSWAEDTLALKATGFQRSFFRAEFSPWSGDLASTDCVVSVSLNDAKRIRINNHTGHKDYLQLPSTYTGLWLADVDQIQTFMQSSAWEPQEMSPWGIREMAASGLQFVNVPDGFATAAVVPFSVSTGQVSMVASIWHVSNNYCGVMSYDQQPEQGQTCSVLLTGLLQTQLKSS